MIIRRKPYLLLLSLLVFTFAFPASCSSADAGDETEASEREEEEESDSFEEEANESEERIKGMKGIFVHLGKKRNRRDVHYGQRCEEFPVSNPDKTVKDSSN